MGETDPRLNPLERAKQYEGPIEPIIAPSEDRVRQLLGLYDADLIWLASLSPDQRETAIARHVRISSSLKADLKRFDPAAEFEVEEEPPLPNRVELESLIRDELEDAVIRSSIALKVGKISQLEMILRVLGQAQMVEDLKRKHGFILEEKGHRIDLI